MTTIVALGDSTTAGTPGFRSPLEHPPDGRGDPESQYAYWLAKTRPEWRVLNRGVDGERSDQIRGRFARDVLGSAADLVIIIAGVNDIYQGRSAAVVEHELAMMYESAQAARPRVRVVAGTIIPYNTATPAQNQAMHAVNEWIRGYSVGRRGVSFCDTRAAVCDPANPDRLLSSADDLHPSPDGYRRMAAALRPVIIRMLSSEHPLL